MRSDRAGRADRRSGPAVSDVRFNALVNEHRDTNEPPRQRDRDELLDAVVRLAWTGTGELRCEEEGHSGDHVCLLAPSERTDHAALREALDERFGRPRDLARDGHADPAATRRTGLPLLTPFGEHLVDMHGWAHAGRWIGCGTVRGDVGVRPVLLVAEGRQPAVDLPQGSSWVDGVAAVTGRDVSGARTVDWADVEARLGTPLPGDYKQLVEIFGEGAFDGYLDFHVPDAHVRTSDIVRHSKWLSEWAASHGSRLWRPYELYPAPGGLLKWGSTEQADGFFWLTEDADPDRWPVLMTDDTCDNWTRFDGTTAECVHRMLTDRRQPFSMARWYDRHWFQGYGSDEQVT